MLTMDLIRLAMRRLRDYLRGYSDADLASARVKMAQDTELGQYVELTDHEFNAICAIQYDVPTMPPPGIYPQA